MSAQNGPVALAGPVASSSINVPNGDVPNDAVSNDDVFREDVDKEAVRGEVGFSAGGDSSAVDVIEVSAGPSDELLFKRRVNLRLSIPELWRSRELIRTLAEREIRARYKQAFLGASWAVITPVVLMLVFTVFLKRVAKIETDGVPYPLFSYLGLLPWTFFSTSVNSGGQSLVSN
ncbi:MAG: ABC transporter permease, partial [Pseudonocardiaceae bacterium]